MRRQLFFQRLLSPVTFPTMTTQAPFNLQRFLYAQENNYTDALREIKQFSLHKNTQQNATKIRNKMPQKCAMIWWRHLFFIPLQPNLMQIYYGLLTKNGGWTTN